nr:hypothetical protein [Metamycoplasma hominis]
MEKELNVLGQNPNKQSYQEKRSNKRQEKLDKKKQKFKTPNKSKKKQA